MLTGLLSLPPEILIEILAELPYRSLFAAICTCKTLHALVATSPRIQYALQSSIAGVAPIDESLTLHPVASRLEALRKREENWSNLTFTGVTEIPVRHRPSGIYDLTAGVYLLGESARATRGADLGNFERRTKAVRFVRLPTKPTPSEDVEWERIDIGEDVVDIGLNVHEHDLIAIVTHVLETPISSEALRSNPGTLRFWNLRLHLLCLSTGKPHPLARQPVLYLGRAGAGYHSIGIEIVGRALILLVLYPPDREQDDMFVYDWMTGDLLMKASVDREVYSSFTPLTHDLIVMPNHRTNHLDIIRIPCAAPAPQSTSGGVHIEVVQEIKPILSLGLPILLPGIKLVRSSCRGEPNPGAPTSTSYPASVDAPLFTSPPRSSASPAELHPSAAQDAVIIFNLFIQDQTTEVRGPFGVLFAPMMAFAFVVHRRALCELVKSHCEVAPSPPPAFSGGSESLEDTAVASSTPQYPTVPWNTWGPTRTRWFEGEDSPGIWITTTCGQRYVNIREEREPDESACIHVYDFNPLAVKRLIWEKKEREERERTVRKAMEDEDAEAVGGREAEPSTEYALARGRFEYEMMDLEAFGSDRLDEERVLADMEDGGEQNIAEEPFLHGARLVLPEDEYHDVARSGQRTDGRARAVTEPAVLRAGNVFQRAVMSHLPYVSVESEGLYEYQSVLADEGRVLGLKASSRMSCRLAFPSHPHVIRLTTGQTKLSAWMSCTSTCKPRRALILYDSGTRESNVVRY
ncbi:hypothetical protein PUNSTDRAFT_126874 [Punctularia strigosozonata HHB-11173 SS5]|uniref:uncharacterized protein n=1 Tax=Punctularia strigosozonata (strain HHB-11173) TaxID=741275 RepID=UPI0004416B8D|nr:uncharacterized protein PUNSTDRAFT_126874 [Punctularia strigosozonata HHB-11173 SS5]EIN08121.1 hypothetical protein PUNSTDRAFT_126874 [Punctularia strigosozonata HHB-11173 SS5]